MNQNQELSMSRATIKNPEFVKRMVVDAENMVEVRKKFFNGKHLSPEVINAVIAITPEHRDINWGADRLTMIPWSALEHLQRAIKDTVSRHIEGDFIETGAWRGGTCILAKAVYNDLRSDKKVFVADSFQGLPKPDVDKYPDDKNDTHYLDENMKASLETVKNNFKQFDLLDDGVVFLKGWFKDTMPTAPIKKISILRLDGDMYESTIDVLAHLYHKLSIGGYCIIDDYNHPPCRAAVQDFRSKHRVTEPIIKVDSDPLNEVHYWIKQKLTTFVNRKYPKKGLGRTIRNSKKNTVNLVNISLEKVIKLFKGKNYPIQ